MTRVRTDDVFGTTTDNPLTSGATTMNSAGLANLAVVSSAEAFITLDPRRLAGAPEIVVVTAHTGSATSATIQRGQFGTTARQHASGTEWVHGPIASNATTYVTAADDQGDYPSVNSWETWAPTHTNITVGSGTVSAQFMRIGRTIHFRWKFILGAGSAIGTSPQFTLPVAAHADWAINMPIGVCNLVDEGTLVYFGVPMMISTTTVVMVAINAGGAAASSTTITATVPFTWVSTDKLMVVGTYEAAS